MNRQERKQVVKTARYYHFNVETDYIDDNGYMVPAQATVCIGQFGGKFSAGISLCCPEDQFSRLDGRRRAMKRAINPKSVFRATLLGNTQEEAVGVIEHTLKAIIDNKLNSDKDVLQFWMTYPAKITPRGKKRKHG